MIAARKLVLVLALAIGTTTCSSKRQPAANNGDAGGGDEGPVTTLAELRAELRAIRFTHTLEHHGRSDLVTAADDANFEIPAVDETGLPPRFVVEPTKHRRLTRRQRVLLERHPTPPAIRTEHLRPRNLAVRWIHDRETGEVRYRIEVQ